MPHAETISRASGFRSLGRAAELTLEASGVPRTFGIGEASGLSGVSELTLRFADTSGRRPHAHGGGEARVASETSA